MANNNKQSYIAYFESLGDAPLPDQIDLLSLKQLEDVKLLITHALDKERAGMDKFFDSVSQTLKYIPNFIILAITNKYIEPPIAARITAKLSLKQASAIAKGLQADYLAETSVFLEDEFAADLMNGMAKNKAEGVANILFEKHPLKALDITSFIEAAFFKKLNLSLDTLDVESEHLSQRRLDSLKKLGHVFKR